MDRFYDADDCRRKANQHWEMAGEARQDRDKEDEYNHTRMAVLWDKRANSGGYLDEES